MAAGIKRAVGLMMAAACAGATPAACSDGTPGATPPSSTAPAAPSSPAPSTRQSPAKAPDKPADSTPVDQSPRSPDAASPVEATPAATSPTTPIAPTQEATTSPANPKLETTKIKIEGTEYELEMALTDETRFHGLSGRAEIPEKGGMIFVFQRPVTTGFVMRDCPVPIDIIFLNAGGRITAIHAMQPEAPRSEAEKTNLPPFMGAPQWAWTNPLYEARLKKYPSRASAQFAIELKGGTLAKLNLKPGQLIEFDREALIKKAK